jgi:hypothetical protein
VKRALPRQQLVEDGAEGENIRAVIDRRTAHLFRRHVPYRAEHGAGGRRGSRHRGLAEIGRRRELREPEVQNLHAAVVGQKQILRLEVAVHDPLTVRRGEAGGDLDRDGDRASRRKRPGSEPASDRLTLEQLRDDIERAVVGADVVDGENVRVAQRADGLRLLLQPPDQIRVVRTRGGHDLDRHVTLQAIVPGSIHVAHPTRTQRADDLVWTQTRAGTQRHTDF